MVRPAPDPVRVAEWWAESRRLVPTTLAVMAWAEQGPGAAAGGRGRDPAQRQRLALCEVAGREQELVGGRPCVKLRCEGSRL